MPTQADLHRAVEAAVAAGRIGRPVFVRYFWQGPEAPSEMPSLAPVVRMVASWLGQPADRENLLSSQAGRRGHVALMLQCGDGATALLTSVSDPSSESVIDLMVLGNRGAIYLADAGLCTGGCGPVGRPGHSVDRRSQSAGDLRSSQWPGRETGPQQREAARKVRYGILLVSGGRTHQEDYAAAFAADGRCRIVAVSDEADIDPRRRALNEQLARALGVPHESDLDRALARPDVHVVSVCAPPERRGRIAVRCAEAGKHLYLDKPLAPSLADADAVVDAVRRTGVRSHMFSFITQHWAREAKRILEGGRLGELLGIHADVFFAKGRAGTATPGPPRREEYPPRRHQLAEAKRELDNVGVYPVSLVRWLTGRRFATVLGITANYFFAEHQKHDVEDFGSLACTLEDGVPVTIAAGRCGWTSHPAGGVNRLVLVGSERTLLVDANRPRLEVCTDEPPWQPPAIHPADPMSFWTSTPQEVRARPKRAWVPVAPPGESDAGYFIDCLDAGRESEMSIAEAALATEVLLAGYCSAATGKVAALPLPRGAPSVRQ
jgi:predicted dehydrogenase